MALSNRLGAIKNKSGGVISTLRLCCVTWTRSWVEMFLSRDPILAINYICSSQRLRSQQPPKLWHLKFQILASQYLWSTHCLENPVKALWRAESKANVLWPGMNNSVGTPPCQTLLIILVTLVWSWREHYQVNSFKNSYFSTILRSYPWSCRTLNANCNFLDNQTQLAHHFHPWLLALASFPRSICMKALHSPPRIIKWDSERGSQRPDWNSQTRKERGKLFPHFGEGPSKIKGVTNDKQKDHPNQRLISSSEQQTGQTSMPEGMEHSIWKDKSVTEQKH